MRKKRFFCRAIRNILLFLCLLGGVGTAFLWVRPLFAESLDLSLYDPASDAEEYRALPFAGPNFAANSRPGYGAGRYYLKGKTTACILAAYAELEKSRPDVVYLYGETGWKGGGRFRPHRTHQQGMSADFMTPVYVSDKNGKRASATLPCGAGNLWGYNIRLDADGRYEEYRLDTAAMIAHLAALDAQAARHGIRVQRVIFDPPLLKLLRADPEFRRLRGMNFMEQKAWFPHDSHYHVDFEPLRK